MRFSRRIERAPLILALVLGLGPSSVQGQGQVEAPPDHPREILIPSLPPYAPPLPRQIEMEDGRVISVMSDDSGFMHGVLRYRAGTADEPPGAIGVASLLADVMRASGSEIHPGSEIDVWLAERGASLTIDAQLECFEVQFTCLDADWDAMLERLSSILDTPRLDATELEHARKRLLASLAQQLAKPALLADWALAVVAYGVDSPIARRPSRESLSAITPDDLADFHRRRIMPRDVVVGLTGRPTDEQLQAIGAMLSAPTPDPEAAATDVEEAQAPARQFAGFIHPARTRVWIVDRPEALHSEVRVAAPGLRKLDPEGSELELWSRIVGRGGRAHRLGQRLPERSVVAGFHPEWTRAGAFSATFNAPNAQVRRTLDALLETLEDSRTSVSRDEVDRVRQRLMNEELFATDTPRKALERTLDLIFHGYPEDFYRQRLLSWRNATPEILGEAARERLDPARLLIVAVGPLAQLKESLQTLGQVEELPLERAMAPGGSQPEQVESMLAALGGRQAWADAVAIQAQIDIVLPSREIPSRQWSELAGPRFRAEYLMASETVVLVVDADRMVQVTSSGRAVLSEEAHRAQLTAKRRGLWQILHRLARDAGLHVRVDADHSLVIQDDEGLNLLLELDENDVPTRLIDRSPEEPVARDFLDWSTEGPLAFPARIALPGDGIEWRVEAFQALAEFDPLLLEVE